MKEFELDPSLIRKLLFLNYYSSTKNNNEKKITTEASQVVGELIRQFIIECRHRASIEAEFENEMSTGNSYKKQNTKKECKRKRVLTYESNNDKNRKRNRVDMNTDLEHDKDNEHNHKSDTGKTCYIQPKHLLMISAEILMDFS